MSKNVLQQCPKIFCNFVQKVLAKNSGGETEVAYNPDDVSAVWIIENGRYIRFELIESRFDGRSFDAVEELKQKQRQISKDAKQNVDGNIYTFAFGTSYVFKEEKYHAGSEATEREQLGYDN